LRGAKAYARRAANHKNARAFKMKHHWAPLRQSR